VSELAERTGSRRHKALAEFAWGCAAIATGDDDRARDLLQSALATNTELGLEYATAETLDQLAVLAGRGGDGARMARLAAVSAATRTRLGCAPLPPYPNWLPGLRESVIERDGQGMWDAAWAEGHGLALADAIAYARRARGPRDRPPAGWASLTPAEAEVAQLAATGMSNPQIASQLFMSRSTVKMHLSNVYLELRIGNRTELARAAAIRSGAEPPMLEATSRSTQPASPPH
jgi:DNA-binding CsgD family transcriptional regulator